MTESSSKANSSFVETARPEKEIRRREPFAHYACLRCLMQLHSIGVSNPVHLRPKCQPIIPILMRLFVFSQPDGLVAMVSAQSA